jgi:imidazolonepropionase-like amidohydrolase
VKKAIDAGLAREDALRAFTLSPAEIYGVADRLGSIEKGKIANLVLTKGDIFDSNTHIETVFVDGKPYKPVAEAPPGGRGQTTEEPGEIR